MSADALLSRLEGVRKCGAGRWRAMCPVCGGANRTKVSITEKPGGVVLARCFSCGASGPALCAAVGVAVDELFPPSASFDDRERRPRDRRPFHADDALRLIEHEVTTAATLIAVIGSVAELKPAQRTELLQSASTIRQAMQACGLKGIDLEHPNAT
jgi:hypothetical protein